MRSPQDLAGIHIGVKPTLRARAMGKKKGWGARDAETPPSVRGGATSRCVMGTVLKPCLKQMVLFR